MDLLHSLLPPHRHVVRQNSNNLLSRPVPDEQKRSSQVRRSLEESMTKVVPGFFREYSTQVILGLKIFRSNPRFIPNLSIHTFFPKFLQTPNRNIMWCSKKIPIYASASEVEYLLNISQTSWKIPKLKFIWYSQKIPLTIFPSNMEYVWNNFKT